MSGQAVTIALLKGAAVTAGTFLSLSFGASLCLRAASAVAERQRARVAPPCSECQGQKTYPCLLCRGEGSIRWSPLANPTVLRPCLCPTCNGTKAQKCLNCIGKGYV